MWLLGTEVVAKPWLAAALSEGAAERTRFFQAQRAPFGFYGFEAMALILDAIAAGGATGTRSSAPRAARRIATRFSAATRWTTTATRRQPPTAAWPS
jgi:hypothetical protein